MRVALNSTCVPIKVATDIQQHADISINIKHTYMHTLTNVQNIH